LTSAKHSAVATYHLTEFTKLNITIGTTKNNRDTRTTTQEN